MIDRVAGVSLGNEGRKRKKQSLEEKKVSRGIKKKEGNKAADIMKYVCSNRDTGGK